MNQADAPRKDRRLAIMRDYLHSRHSRLCWPRRHWRKSVRAVECPRCALELEIAKWKPGVRERIEDQVILILRQENPAG